MNKLILIVSLTILLLFFMACGSQGRIVNDQFVQDFGPVGLEFRNCYSATNVSNGMRSSIYYDEDSDRVILVENNLKYTLDLKRDQEDNGKIFYSDFGNVYGDFVLIKWPNKDLYYRFGDHFCEKKFNY